MITAAQKQYLLDLKPDDLTFTKLVEIFGDTVTVGEPISKERKSKFSTTDQLFLLSSEYFVKEKTLTTVGRFIFNKYLIERMGFQDITGYVNHPLTAGAYNKMESAISNALIEDKITIDQFREYLDYRDTLGMQLNSVITTSFTWKTVKSLPSVEKRKQELFKQYDKELSNGDIFISEKIEKELVAMAKKELAGDPGLDLYNSEARGNFGNYKNMNIFKGATMNNKTGQYEIVRSSFMEGIRKDDIPSFGDAVVSGAFPKAVNF